MEFFTGNGFVIYLNERIKRCFSGRLFSTSKFPADPFFFAAGFWIKNITPIARIRSFKTAFAPRFFLFAIVLVLSIDSLAQVNGNANACESNVELYTASASGFNDYNWTVSGGTVVGGGGLNDDNVTIRWDQGGGDYLVEVTYNGGTNENILVHVDWTPAGVPITKTIVSNQNTAIDILTSDPNPNPDLLDIVVSSPLTQTFGTDSNGPGKGNHEIYDDGWYNGSSSPVDVVYTITPVSFDNGCPGSPFTITVTINPAPPTITDFSPKSGPVGSTVSLTGVGFDPTPANNIVYFGATQGVVTGSLGSTLDVTVPFGANYDLITLTVNGRTAVSATPFDVTFNSNGVFDGTSFAPAVGFTTDLQPTGVAIGDIDGDGWADMVAANNGANSVTVYRNAAIAGSVNSSRFSLSATLGGLVQPHSILLVDMDGDGKKDIVLSDAGGAVSIFRNNATPGSITTGSFEARVDLFGGLSLQGLAVDDIDRDGKPDIAAGDFTGNAIYIFKNNATAGTINSGSFDAPESVAVSSSIFHVAIADIDGDGLKDLVSVSGSTISIVHNTFYPNGVIAGIFDVPVDFPVGTNLRHIVVADIDLDGKPDILTAESGNVYILKNQSLSQTINTGSLAPVVAFPAGTLPFQLGVADLDGDAKPDVAVTDPLGNVYVLRNLSSVGTIDGSSLGTAASLPLGSTPRAIAIGDLTNDGAPELIVSEHAGGTIAVFENTMIVKPPVISLFTPISGAPGSTVTITGTGFGPPGANVVFFGASRATISNETATQLDVIVPIGATYSPITVVNTNAARSVDSAVPFTPTFAPGGSLLSIGSFTFRGDFGAGPDDAPSNMNVGDLDANTLPDIVANIGRINTLINGSFGNSFAFPTGTANPSFAASGRPTIADLNSDGYQDIVYVTGSDIHIGYSGTLGAEIVYSVPSGASGTVATGDWNGDGKLDLGIISSTNVLFFDNATSFSQSPFTLTSGSTPLVIATGDFDVDGLVDLAIAYSDGAIHTFRNTSTINSVSFNEILPARAVGGNATRIVVGDFDNDGLVDMLAIVPGLTSIPIYRRSGPFVFTQAPDYVLQGTLVDAAWGDVDGDGMLDLAITEDIAGNRVTAVGRNVSTPGTIGFNQEQVAFQGGNEIIMADFNGDQRPDIIVNGINGLSATAYQNDVYPAIPFLGNFTPLSGPVGTTVTITGNNFDPTALNNSVYFGGVLANVTGATATSLNVTVPAGATFKPISVTVAGRTSYSAIPFDVTFPSSTSISTGSFGPRVDFGASGSPIDIALADFDGDGKNDVVESNVFANTISIFRNTSTIGIINAGSYAAAVDLGGLNHPVGLAVSDLDGDGKQDIVVTNQNGNAVAVFRNISTPGTLSFESPVFFATGAAPLRVASGDIDGDGKPDLVTANYLAGTISVLKNVSSPGAIVVNSFATNVDFVTGLNPIFATIRDLDGDGKQDVAVANYGDNSVSILRNVAIAGSITSGSLQPKVDYLVGNPTIVLAEDLDADGKPELILPDKSLPSIYVLGNNSSGGGFNPSSFTTPFIFNVGATIGGTSPQGLLVDDLNGDGKPDIAVANENEATISVFENIGAGPFGSGSLGSRVNFSVGNSPDYIASGDVDNDGKPELVVANFDDGNFSVLQNIVAPQAPAPAITSFSPTAGPVGTSVTITGTNFDPIPSNNIVYFGPARAIVTSATTTSLTVFVPNGATSVAPIIVENKTTGLQANSINTIAGSSFARQFTVTHTPHLGVTAANYSRTDLNVGNVETPTLGDFNDDGVADLLTSGGTNNNSIYISLGSVVTGFGTATQITNANSITPYIGGTGDFNGDGKLDFVTTNYGSNDVTIYLGQGNGTFNAGTNFTVGDLLFDNPYKCAITDLNNDGKLDLVTVNRGIDDGPHNGHTISVLLGNGNGTFGAFNKLEAGYNPIDIVAGDFNGDGNADVVVSDLFISSATIFAGDGAGGLSIVGSLSTGTYPNKVITGDFNNDNKLDLVFQTSFNDNLIIFPGNGDGTFTPYTNLISQVQNFYGTIAGDFNGDGNQDLAFNSYTGSVMGVMLGDGAGNFSAPAYTPVAANPNWLITGDFNNDGKADLASGAGSSTLSVLLNTNPSPPSITSISPVSGPIGTSVTITGTNFDLTPANNIVYFGGVKALVTAASGTSLTVTVPAGATYTPIIVTTSNLTAVSTKNFNVTFSGGTTISSNTFRSAVTFPDADIPYSAALGDLDGDGKLDLVTGVANNAVAKIYRNVESTNTISAASFASPTLVNAYSTVDRVFLHDLDGDGRLDIILDQYGAGYISIHRNTSTPGNLSFAPLSSFGLGVPYDIAVGDPDKDGRLDFFVTDQTAGGVIVMKNLSTPGNISLVQDVTLPTGGTPVNIRAADIDGDGNIDIVAGLASGGISLLRGTGNPTISLTSFESVVSFGGVADPREIVTADFDRDGKIDIAVADYAINAVTVFKNVSTAGTINPGSLVNAASYPVGGSAFAMATSDFNGDGKVDIVTSGQTSVILSVLKNSTTPGVIDATSFAASVDFSVPGGGSNDVVTGDIDGDGKPDIVVTDLSNSNFFVLQDQAAPTPPVIADFAPKSGAVGTSVTISGSNFDPTPANNIVYFGATRATVTTASPTTLTATVPVGATFEPITVTVTGLTGASSSAFDVTFTHGATFTAANFASPDLFNTVGFVGGGTKSTVADFDGDGKPDMASTSGSNNISIFRNISTPGNINQTRFDIPVSSGPVDIAASDMDGDGKLDIVGSYQGPTYGIFVLRNMSSPGSIAFDLEMNFAAGLFFGAVSIGDLDQDGLPEIVSVDFGSSEVSILKNVSSIAALAFAPRVTLTCDSGPKGIDLADLDGDGKMEIVTVNLNSISLFKNVSSLGILNASSFDPKIDITGINTTYGANIVAADFDGDSKLDLAFPQGGSTNGATILLNQYTGVLSASSFSTPFDFSIVGPSVYAQNVAVGDINGDGKPDIILDSQASSAVFVLKNTFTTGILNAGSFASAIQLNTLDSTVSPAIADFDGDGKVDVVATVYNDQLAFFRNQTVVPIPVITSFSPTSGPVGTSVTITGTNFDSTPANNVVYFGATKASVTAASANSLTVVVPSGATQKPISVTVAGNTGYSAGSFDVTFPSGNSISTRSFAPPQNFTKSGASTGVALADFDGDGVTDIVATNQSANTISVFRNTSTIGSITNTQVEFATQSQPYSVVVADFDGDGKLDIAVSNHGSNSISVLRNTATPGTIDGSSFAPAVNFAVGGDPYFLATTDLDLDGKPDIIAPGYLSATASILRNTSTPGIMDAGSFAASVDFATGINPIDVATGDINGDNKPEIIISGTGGNTLSIHQNNTAIGLIDGASFSTKTDFAVNQPEIISVSDLDGDNKLDIAVSSNGAGVVSVWRNSGVGGAITAASLDGRIDLPTANGSYGLTAADLDGDGKTDLTATIENGGTSLYVLRNIGTAGIISNGSFQTAVPFNAGINPQYVAAGDLDGDHKPELVVANASENTISVFLNTNLPGPSITTVTPTSGPIGTSVTITGTNFDPTPANNIVYFGATRATVTAASVTSLTVTVPVGSTYSPLSVEVNGYTTLSAASFDVTFTGGSIYASTFSPQVNISAGNKPYGVVIHDLDGDGKADLVIPDEQDNTISLYRNISVTGTVDASSFSPRVTLSGSGFPTEIGVGDLDGDGKPDLAVTNYNANTVSVFRNTSTLGSVTSGSFTAEYVLPVGTGTNPFGISLGDLNQDGRLDIAVANFGTNSITVYVNSSSPGNLGVNSFAAPFELTAGSQPTSVAIADLDGDGLPDIVSANTSSQSLSVFRNLGTGGALTASSFSAGIDLVLGISVGVVKVGDLDGDGKPDIAVTGNNGVSILKNQSTPGSLSAASFAAPLAFTAGSGAVGLSLGDIDGDGKADLATANLPGNNISILKNNSVPGTISFSSNIDFPAGSQPVRLAVGDLDGDSKPEVVVSNYSGANLSIYHNLGLSAVPTITSFSPGSGPVGTSVTITGTNFDPTPANNIVYFGATKATVTAATSGSLTVTVPSGATYRPISVLVNDLVAYSSAPYIVTFVGGNGVDANSFATKQDVTAGTTPYGVALGDLDGDGKADIAGTNLGGGVPVSIYLNTTTAPGSISFAPKVDFGTGGGRLVTLGDFDGDGKLDLAVPNLTGVSVYRNTSSGPGNASLASSIDYPTGAGTRSASVADFDGDGRVDIALSNLSSNTVSVLRNTSSGPGVISFASKVDLTTATGPFSVEARDLDNDGKMDLAVANTTSNSVSVFLNTSTSGSVSFLPKVDFATATGPQGISIGDLDNDGKADIAVAANTGNVVSVLRNFSSGPGNMNFAAHADFATATPFVGITITDLDGDGNADIAASSSGSNAASVFKNTTSGPGNISFAAVVNFATGSGPTGIAAGDLDNDGRADIVVAAQTTNTLSILRNTVVGPPVITSFTPTSGTIGSSVTITGAHFDPTPANNTVYFGATKATVNSASSTSLTVTVPPGAVSVTPLIVQDVVTGLQASSLTSVTPMFTVTTSPVVALKYNLSSVAMGTAQKSIAIADFNGDGKSDFATANQFSNDVSIRLGDGLGGFTGSTTISVGNLPQSIAIGDFNGDGKSDFVTANYGSGDASIALGDGSGGFSSAVSVPIAINPSAIAIGDFNGDGKLDFVVGTAAFDVHIRLGDGLGGFSGTSSFNVGGTVSFAFTTADFNRDNKLDLAIVAGSSITIRLGDGLGGFSVGPSVAVGLSPSSIAVGDFNVDGKVDLAVANSNSNSVSIRLGDGLGGFTGTTDIPIAGPYWVTVGDFNGDGKADFATADAGTNGVSIRVGDGLGGFSGSTYISVSPNGNAPTSIAAGDFNGDGKADLAVANNNSGSASILLWVPTPPPTITSFAPTSGPVGTSVTIAGTNFDPTPSNNIVYFGAIKAIPTAGSANSLTVIVPPGATSITPLLVQNILTGTQGSSANSSTPRFTVTNTPVVSPYYVTSTVGVGTVPYAIATADFNNDGKADLATANRDSNDVSIRLGDGAGGFTGSTSVGVGTTPWSIAVGDFNGDGKPDFATANNASNDVSIRLGDGAGGFTFGPAVSAGTSPSYIAVEDFNGDGFIDLAVANHVSNDVSIRLGDGLGGFFGTTTIPAGTQPHSIAVADLNGDAKVDLAIGNINSNDVSLRFGDGTGGFSGSTSVTMGTTVYSVTLGDFNGDGKTDFATANGASNNIGIRLGDGVGGFSGSSTVGAGTTVYMVLPGDFNGDGKTDLAAVNQDSNDVSIRLGDGAGNFSGTSSIAAGTNPISFVVGDLNNDGKAYIAAANLNSNNVTIALWASVPVPTIASFTPQSGPVGTSVTITGTNFDPIPTNNIVYFGATKASVSAASATSLTVTVPSGATYQPITVLTNGLQAYSSQPFAVTFAGGPGINSVTSFAPGVNFATGVGDHFVALGDIDGDGKSDVVVTNNTSNSISVFRNTSISGSISAGSFAAGVQFTTAATPRNPTIADVDGDGKLDIVVPGFGANVVSIFRNISSAGSINAGSLAARVDFTAGTNPFGSAVRDVDGDGRADIIVGNNGSSSISILMNIGSPGSITAGSFATKVDFATGSFPNHVALGDLDNDGKPDLTVANYASNTLYVYKNTSTSGSITVSSLAAPVVLNGVVTPFSVAISDLDGDGKPDIVNGNQTSGTVSVFRNISSTGVLTAGSFAANVDYTVGGTSLGVVSIGDLDGDAKPEFIITDSGGNTVSVFRNASSPGPFNASSFSRINFSTGNYPYGTAIGDVDGDGKPEMLVTNYNDNTVSIYRNTIGEILPPSITSFTPISGPVGTSVTITGTNFDTTPINNRVYFGATKATVSAATATSLTVTVPAGVTYQPITVNTNAMVAQSRVPFLVTFPGGGLISGNTFAPKIDFTGGTQEWAVGVADVDGDGKVDLATANRSSNSISILRNASSGVGNINYDPKVDFATAPFPRYVNFGDFDGDGKLDMAAPNNGSTSVSVFRNTGTGAGNVGYAAKVDFTSGATPQHVSIGDFDGDGKLDMVVPNNGSSSISVFQNTSSGPGNINFATKVDFPTASGPQSSAVADFDGDGKPDIVATNFTAGSSVSVFLNISSGAGNINFAAKADFTTGSGPYILAVGDVDGDGKIDLVVPNRNSNTLSVLLNNSSGPGNLNFATKVDLPTGVIPYGVALSDLNGDGKLDILASANTDNVLSVYQNNGTPGNVNFRNRVNFVSGTGPSGVAIADFDGDNLPDLVEGNFTSNNVSVLRNTGVFQFPPTITSFTPLSGAVGSSVTITGTNFDSTPVNNTVYFGATLATVNSASATTLTVTVPPGATNSSLSVTTGGLTGVSSAFFSPTFTTSGIFSAASLSPSVEFSTDQYPTGYAIKDIDHDGKPDIAVADNVAGKVSVFKNNFVTGSLTGSSLASFQNFNVGNQPTGLDLNDIDGDGWADLITTNFADNSITIYRNQQTAGVINSGTFTGAATISVGNNPYGLATGDLDGDGKPDVVVTNYGGGSGTTFSVLLNNGSTGSITAGSFAGPVNFPSGLAPNSVAIADLNADGKLDVLVGSPNGDIQVQENQSSGSLQLATAFTLTTGPVNYLSVGDADGDGKLDIIVASSNSNITIFRNSNSGGALSQTDFATSISIAGPPNPTGRLIDLDGDAKPELVVTSRDNSNVSVYKNVATPGALLLTDFQAPHVYSTGAGPGGVLGADLDLDGLADLVTVDNTNISTNQISILRNQMANPPVPSITSFTPTTGPVGTSVTITGTNFDPTATNNFVYFGAIKAIPTAGTTTSLTVTVPVGATSVTPIEVHDVVTGLRASSLTSVTKQFVVTRSPVTPFAFNSSSIPLSNQIFSVTTGDFNNDGKTDFAGVGYFANTAYVRLGDGAGGFIGTTTIGTGAGPRSIATGDFNNDGNQDLAIASYLSSTVIIRLGDGAGNFSGSTSIGVGSGGGTYQVVVGDVNNDGIEDLLTANPNTATMSLRIGDGTGGFSGGGEIPMGSVGTYSVTFADFNNDGKLDIAGALYGSNAVGIKLGDGTGGFSGTTTISVGTNPSYVVAGDFNKDGKIDIASADSGGTVSIRLGDGAGAFSGTTSVPVGTNSSSIGLADFNGDGNIDLAVANFLSSDISVRLGDGVGGFTGTMTLAAAQPNSIAIGDFNNDGNADIASAEVSGNDVAIYLLVPLSAPTISSIAPSNGPVGTAVTITGTNFNSTPGNNRVYFGSMRVIPTTASTTSLTVSVPPGAASVAPIIVEDITTSLQASSMLSGSPLFTVTTTPTISPYYSSSAFAVGTNPQSIATGDFNEDGKMDLAIANVTSNDVSIRRGDGLGGFTGTTTIGVGTFPYQIVIGDFNGDGHQDFATANNFSNNVSIRLGDGTGGFSGSTEVSVGSGPYSVALGDFNNDGKLDFASANFSSNDVSIRIGDGLGGFSGSTSISVGTFPTYVAVADFNKDGKADLSVNSGFLNRVEIKLGDGTGGFAGATTVSVDGSPYATAFADFNEDGNVDFVSASHSFGTANVRLGDGLGGFSGSTAVTVNNYPRSIAIGDFNGDGHADFATPGDVSNKISVVLGDGLGGFAAPVSFSAGSSPYGITTGDFNSDGKADVATANFNGNNVSVLLWTSPPPTVTSFTPTFGPIGTSVTITGSNFDATPANNIVYFGATRAIVNSASNTSLTVTVPAGATYQPIVVLVNGLLAYSSQPFVTTFAGGGTINLSSFETPTSLATGALPNFVAIGDLDGDGKADLAVASENDTYMSVYRNTSSGTGNISYAPKVDFPTGLQPFSIAIADLDGDGKGEIVTADIGSNTVSVFLNTSSGPGNNALDSK